MGEVLLHQRGVGLDDGVLLGDHRLIHGQGELLGHGEPGGADIDDLGRVLREGGEAGAGQDHQPDRHEDEDQARKSELSQKFEIVECAHGGPRGRRRRGTLIGLSGTRRRAHIFVRGP
jgi:hypothetical protein